MNEDPITKSIEILNDMKQMHEEKKTHNYFIEQVYTPAFKL
jgi:hypothetical protein